MKKRWRNRKKEYIQRLGSGRKKRPTNKKLTHKKETTGKKTTQNQKSTKDRN